MQKGNNETIKRERIPEIDFLKGVLLTLMVTFHLQLITTDYPTLTTAVYTFHMPAFLIISGYLANINKTPTDFGKGMLRLIIPYAIFELIYITLLFYIGKIVGTSNTIESLTPLSIINHIVIAPTGTYWYLHTLIICSIAYYISYTILHLKAFPGLILTGTILYGISFICNLQWVNAWYFLIGIFIAKCCGMTFTQIIQKTWMALVPLIFLFANDENLDRGTLAGIIITILTISIMLQLHSFLPQKINNLFAYLGKNSLSIVVFSPIFTAALKKFGHFFSFDPTDICFAVFATTITMFLSILSSWIFDKTSISRIIFFKKNIYTKYK